MTSGRMIEGGRVDEWLDGRVRSLAQEHGYSEVSGLPFYIGDFCLDFVRDGSHFPTEILRFTFFEDAQSLMVTFIGSYLDTPRLCAEGLSGRSAGKNLFDYQFDFLEKSPREVLGKTISFDMPSEPSSLIDRLAVEIREVDSLVWSSLLRAAEGLER